ncbi:uncharacterized protein LOC125237240 [Leguminivora glycinivorella]|uniref:uncharacterized protein LOC125229506 n=1 Tax=Leguminivora glycinivorella TaxID=1035111 RepID=UPI00200C3F00|nr:uncharacterized protein LOC125229506 [Leguminivora glycinivorella]XP_048000211.1 uncharacterized protein LOC125237240 [Leguminivora glycinivorella]
MAPPPLTNFIQTNLQHKQAATATLRRMLEVNNETVALIQEPWIRKGRICGLNNIGGKLLLDTTVINPRTCIYLPKQINAVLMNEFCSRDLTTVRLQSNCASSPEIIIASAYLPGDADIPTVELANLIRHCENKKLELIVSADANAHHRLWGSESSNRRGKTDSPLCRGCLSAEETVAHVILECEGVNTQRAQILKTTRSLREACGDTRRILRFWAELGWLDP